LLQEPGDSPNVGEYLGKLGRLESEARALAGKLMDFLADNTTTKLIIAYNRQGYLPAACMYWHTMTMDEDKAVILLDMPSASLYALAYREPTPLVIYASNPYTGLLNILQIARIMGHPYIAIAAKPGDERVQNILRNYGVVFTDSSDELDSSLTVAMATYHALAEVYKNKLAKRGDRILSHSREGFTPVSRELIEVYWDTVSKTLSLKDVTVTSGKLLEASAIYLVEALWRRGVRARFEQPELVKGPGELLLAGTSVEEHYLRELKYKFATMGLRINEIILNIDPLEANIYLAILAHYIASNPGSNPITP